MIATKRTYPLALSATIRMPGFDASEHTTIGSGVMALPRLTNSEHFCFSQFPSGSAPMTVYGGELVCANISSTYVTAPAISYGVGLTQAHGVFIGALAALEMPGVGSRLRSLLTDAQREHWKDQIRNLIVLLTESNALGQGALIYASEETLLCELGPPGRTLSLAIDDEGTTISFRRLEDDFDSYARQSWEGLPPLHEFTQLLAEYLRPQKTTWMSPSSQLSITRSSDAAFATTQTVQPSKFRTEAFASL